MTTLDRLIRAANNGKGIKLNATEVGDLTTLLQALSGRNELLEDQIRQRVLPTALELPDPNDNPNWNIRGRWVEDDGIPCIPGVTVRVVE